MMPAPYTDAAALLLGDAPAQTAPINCSQAQTFRISNAQAHRRTPVVYRISPHCEKTLMTLPRDEALNYTRRMQDLIMAHLDPLLPKAPICSKSRQEQDGSIGCCAEERENHSPLLTTRSFMSSAFFQYFILWRR